VERELESKSAQIEHLLAAGPAVLYSCESEPPFRATFVSENVLLQVGYSSDCLVAEPGFWAGCVHPEDRARLGESLARLMKAGYQTHEYRFRCADGEYRWLRDELRLGKSEDGESTFIFGYLVDVTEQKLAEQKIAGLQADLAHAARVSTVGEMSSGLAHELHQPLQSILNHVFACQRVFDGFDSKIVPLALDELRVIEQQALRAGEIIHKLREYVRKGAPDRSRVRLADLLAEVLSFAHGEVARLGVDVAIEMEGDPWVFVDSVQIQQVVLNLIRNAIDAMAVVDGSGRRLLLKSTTPAVGMVEVSLEDFGPIVSEEFLLGAMDHFFSTKPKGLGLGLPISQSIIEAHHGTLTLEPKSSGGVIARFTLPVPK
jgi:two-component system sensor kinase FixL